MINVRIQPEISQEARLAPRIAVIGVGGAGGNAVNNMIETNLQGVEFIVCNSDAQALEHSKASKKVQLGETVTNGLGAGSRPDVGRAAAEENIGDLMDLLEGVNMVFITAGMGGGTGTGAAPIIAEATRAKGILTVGVVTKPFHFEGAHRMRSAEDGLKNMESVVDTLIVIPNQNLFRIANEKTTFNEAFRMADGVLQSGVRGVTDLMVMPGLINLDFNDIRNVMEEMGKAMMGTGEAEGEGRAVKAAEAAVNNPLLDDVSMKGARGVIINITGGYDMTLFEVDEACNHIRDEVDQNANIIFGSTFDDNLEGTMRVSVVATGIDQPMSARGTTTNSQGISARARTLSDTSTQEEQSPAAPKSSLASQTVQPYAARDAVKSQDSDANYTPTVKTPESGYTIPSAPAENLENNVPVLPLMKDTADQDTSSDEFKLTAQPTTTAHEAVRNTAKSFPQVQETSYNEPAPTRRPASLFEKLKSTILPDHDTDHTPARGRAPSVGGQQTTLKVEATPDRAPVVQEETDDLDIPAFLRRQAN